jgi:signal peptidase I
MGRRLTFSLAALGLLLPVCGGAYLVFIAADGAPVHPFRNTSESMAPASLAGDRVTVHMFSPGEEPVLARGAIVVHALPGDAEKQMLKRLMGLPGDTLEMRNGRLRVNGHELPEPYAWHADPDTDPAPADFRWQRSSLTGPSARDTSSYLPSRNNWGPLLVPRDSVFVLGDNRDNSLDSRYFGFSARRDVVGTIRRVYFSRDSLGRIRWGRLGRRVQ